jgi:hypothetical protein
LGDGFPNEKFDVRENLVEEVMVDFFAWIRFCEYDGDMELLLAL